MYKKIIARNSEVLVGVDVHTESHVITVKKAREIVDRYTIRANKKEEWRRYLKRFSECRLHVIYEAGPHGYNLHDMLKELGEEGEHEVFVYIAPPAMIPEAPGRKKVKTDRRDSLKLIQAFESDSFRPVVVPSPEQRARRQLVRERDRNKKEIRRTGNRILSMIRQHGLEDPEGDKWSPPWCRDLLAKAKKKDSSGNIHFVIKSELKILDVTKKVLASIEKRITKQFSKGPAEKVLQTVTRHVGIGHVGGTTIVSEVADFHAFDNSDAFASYTGLVSSAYGSGKVMHLGPITKVGNRRLRAVFVESSWTWVRCDPEAKKRFERLAARRGKKRAIVAMARRLAVRVYHMVVNDFNPAPIACFD